MSWPPTYHTPNLTNPYISVPAPQIGSKYLLRSVLEVVTIDYEIASFCWSTTVAVTAVESSDFNPTIKSFLWSGLTLKCFIRTQFSPPEGGTKAASLPLKDQYCLCKAENWDVGRCNQLLLPWELKGFHSRNKTLFHVDHWNWHIQTHPITRTCSSMDYICFEYESYLT